MSQINKFEDCKREIRSLLISYQRGCLLPEFNKAYMELIGRRLPSREFSFHTDIDFLKAMSDVVGITYTRTGEYHLTAIADEKSKHIQKMVAKQKPAKSKPSTRLSKSSKSYYSIPSRSSKSSYSIPPRFTESKVRCFVPTSRETEQFSATKLQDEVKLRPKAVVKLPPRLLKEHKTMSQKPPREDPILPPKSSPKEEVIALVQYFDNQIACDDLLFQYKRMYLKDLSLGKYGFSSLEECINDIPELYLENINNCTLVVYHPESPYSSDTNETYSDQETSELHSDRINHQNYGEDKRSTAIQSELSSNQNGDKSVVPESLRMKLHMVAERFTEGIRSSEFPSCFKEITGTVLDLHNLGYRCLNDLIDDVPDIFTREPAPGSRKDFIISPVKKSKYKLNESSVSSDHCVISGTNILHYVIVNVRRILQAYTEGIQLEEFSNIYASNCSDILRIKDFGFDDLETFLTSIKNQVPLRINSSKGKKTIHMLHHDDNFTFIKAPETSQNEVIPFDAAYPEFKLKLQNLPDDFDFSKYFPVYTSSVAHPGHLYIQLQGKETTDALVKLGENMEDFYNGSNSGLYTMKNVHIKVGASCVAKWPTDDHWYRSEIISIPCMETVQVHYVDYGTRDTIPVSLLRYIKKEFIHLPAQALRCRLAFLKPPKNATKWDVKSRSQILNLCEDVSLMAKVEEIGSDGIYSIVLCDTTKDEDLYINDILCDEGLADYDVGNVGNSSSAASKPVVPMEYHHNLNPLQALQAQYFLQAFVTVAPSFANNENYINLLREVTSYCSNPDLARQNVNMSFTTGFAPPGFNPLLNVPAYGNSNKLLNAYNVPSQALETSPEKRSNVINPPVPVSSSTETFTSAKSVGMPTDEKAECEIFDDEDDDEIFQEFCEKISSKMRHVKRILLGEGYKIHIIVVDSKPYASSGDISQLIWNNKEPDYLFRRLQMKDDDIPSLSLSEVGNEELFQQLEKFGVKGIQKMTGCKASILLYPLRVVIKILNIFGHPSVTLRTKLTEEVTCFDPDDPEWMKFSSPEPLESEDEENLSGVTDDDKIEKLCLFDLLAMKESITMRRKKIMNNMEANIKSDALEKLEQLHMKVMQRIQEIKEICSVFS